MKSGILIAMLVLIAGSTEAQSLSLWQQMAKQDLDFIHQTLARHHPGPLDELNPTFAHWHEHGLVQVMKQLDKVKTYGGYRAVIQQYVTGFRDGHLNASLNLDYRYVGTPGFSVTWRGEVFDVTDSSINEVAEGDRLVSCDGIDAIELFNTRVLGFRGLGIEADRYRFAGELFRDRVNPLLDRLKHCRFERQGATHTIELDWRWQHAHELMKQNKDKEMRRFSREELADGGVWLAMPTFAPAGEDLATLKEMLDSLKKDRKRAYVVIDVRGNGGGSSYWAEPFVRNLYGDDLYESLNLDADAYAVYRVSEDNLTHFTSLLEQISEREGRDTDFYRHFERVKEGLAVNLSKGLSMYDSRVGDKSVADTPAESEPLFQNRLYLLTDSTCASACLDFADVIMKLPNLVHVGHPTSADTTYMEIRSVRLPSNNGNLGFATKVYRNRTRGHNEAYLPQHRWPGEISDTQALKDWIADLGR